MAEHMKKILIVKAHPRASSFCNALIERYTSGAKANDAEIRTLNLRDLELEPWLKYDWSRNHDSLPASEDLEMMKDVTRFTGVKLVGKHYFGSVVLSSEKKREGWLARACKIGSKDSRRL